LNLEVLGVRYLWPPLLLAPATPEKCLKLFIMFKGVSCFCLSVLDMSLKVCSYQNSWRRCSCIVQDFIHPHFVCQTCAQHLPFRATLGLPADAWAARFPSRHLHDLHGVTAANTAEMLSDRQSPKHMGLQTHSVPQGSPGLGSA